MKIAFVCSSFEPGKDGVGDYIGILSKTLLQKGHKVLVIAINDKFAKSRVSAVTGGILAERFPANFSPAEKAKNFELAVSRFAPQWIILQYGPFAFHNKGLPFYLPSVLERTGNARRAIMFHELWVAMENEAPVKFRLLGLLQKLAIGRLLQKWKPQQVFTQTDLYVKQLTRLGTNAQLLPLFSNIPAFSKAKNSLAGRKPTRGETIILALFGVIHRSSSPGEFAGELAAYAKKNSLEIALWLLGKSSEAERNNWIAAFESHRIPVTSYGIQPAEKLSELMAAASVGIATTAYDVIGKSGTTAALLAHNLPVICVANAWTPSGIDGVGHPKAVVKYVPGQLEEMMDAGFEVPAAVSSVVIADQLLSGLAIYH